MANPSLNRRDAVKLLLAAASASMVVSCGQADSNPNPKRSATSGPFLDAAEMALLTSVAAQIIPTTDTPGAVEAGVPQTIQDLLTGWGADDLRNHWRKGLASVADYFSKAGAKPSFANLPGSRKTELVSALDAGVYGESIKLPFYRDLKSTIASAYYMSEVGATLEREYDPVPGDFIGCMDFDEVGKAWAT